MFTLLFFLNPFKTITVKLFSINRISIFAITTTFCIVLFSCQKDLSTTNSNTVTEAQTTAYSEESTVAEASFDDADDVASTAAEEEGNASQFGINGREFHPLFTELRGAIGDCATITILPNDSTYPKKITINFGDSCVGRDGKVRSGIIMIYLTAPLRKPGSVVTTIFDNYHVNHVHLEGTKVITNLSDSTARIWSVKIVGGKVTFRNGRGYSYESIKYKKQVAGMDTKICRDDVYEIQGRSSIVFNNGTTIDINTETPLVKKVACPWISDGTLKIKINDRILFLDYGAPNNGDCDNKALLTWNNGANQKLIEL